MILDSHILHDRLAEYASPKAKITRLIKKKELIHLRRGLFLEDEAVPKQVLAPIIYGPSYLSFQYALSVYGLIPEKADTFISASYRKNKNKRFQTPVGTYLYLYLPSNVYRFGLNLLAEGGYNYLMACPEKALCDSVYKVSSIKTFHDIETLLFEDWRMEREDLLGMNRAFINQAAPFYGKSSVEILARWMVKTYGA